MSALFLLALAISGCVAVFARSHGGGCPGKRRSQCPWSSSRATGRGGRGALVRPPRAWGWVGADNGGQFKDREQSAAVNHGGSHGDRDQRENVDQRRPKRG